PARAPPPRPRRRRWAPPRAPFPRGARAESAGVRHSAPSSRRPHLPASHGPWRIAPASRGKGLRMETVRWGVLGVAKIATQKVIPAMQETESSRVIGIASRDLARARAAAEQLGIERAYGSYGELLDDPDIEAVYIPLPNHMHAEWTLAAAAAGKHVLCEKPLALTAEEAQRMVDGCEHAGVKLMEAFM